MDIYDKASLLEEGFRDDALARARQQTAQSISLRHCADCGAEIPPARRQAVAGCTRCTECQSAFESYLKRV